MMTALELDTHNLGPVDQIPVGEGRTFRIGEREIAVFRTRAGEVFATQARCPHRGAPLADGILGSGRIVCPFHAFTFELRTGEPVRSSCPALRTYDTSVTDAGELLVSVAPQRGACAE